MILEVSGTNWEILLFWGEILTYGGEMSWIWGKNVIQASLGAKGFVDAEAKLLVMELHEAVMRSL